MNPQDPNRFDQNVNHNFNNEQSQVTQGADELDQLAGRPDVFMDPSMPTSSHDKPRIGWIIRTVIVIIILAVLAIKYVASTELGDSGDSGALVDPAIAQDESGNTSKLIKTSYTVQGIHGGLDPVSVTLEHPDDWVVSQGDDTEAPYGGHLKVKGDLTITSRKGNSLILSDSTFWERGGDCSGMEKIELVKRLPIKTPGYVFDEIKQTNNSYGNEGSGFAFRVIATDRTVNENDKGRLRIEEMIEGDSIEIECSYLINLSSVTNNASSAGVHIGLRNESNPNSKVTYSSIEDDEGFIEMLQSMEIN